MTGAQRLLSDVNLSDVAFREDASEMILDFLNMTDGDEVGSIVCSGILVFSYRLDLGEQLPQYVGEVDYVLVEGGAAKVLLSKFGYYLRSTLENDPPFPKCHHVHIEGGGLCIEIVCTNVKFCVGGNFKSFG